MSASAEVAVNVDCEPDRYASPPRLASEPVAPEIANPAAFSAMLTVLSVAMASTLSARVSCTVTVKVALAWL